MRIKIGVIGTGWISEEFIKSCIKMSDVKVTAAYSRTLQKASDIIEKLNIRNNARAFSSFDEMLNQIDAVYIASPNGLHYEQAKYFLSQQKHVLVEKTAVFKEQEWKELRNIANINQVILMEAFKTIHLPQYKYLYDMSQNDLPFLADIQMNQYSSKLNQVKQGIYPPVFDPVLGKGSTYDMLVYPVELCVSLFGKVIEVKSLVQKLPNGVDLTNLVMLKHENGTLVNITCSKAAYGKSASEIYSDLQTVSFNPITTLQEIKQFDIQTNKQVILYKQQEHENQDTFKYEIQMFADLVNDQDLAMANFLQDITQETIRVLNLVELNQEKLGEY